MTQISTSQFAADLGYVIADLPASFTSPFSTGSKSCALSELSVENISVIAGNIDVRHFEAVFLLSDTTRAPAVNDRMVIINQGESVGTNYETINWRKSPDGIAYHVIVKADHRNP